MSTQDPSSDNAQHPVTAIVGAQRFCCGVNRDCATVSVPFTPADSQPACCDRSAALRNAEMGANTEAQDASAVETRVFPSCSYITTYVCIQMLTPAVPCRSGHLQHLSLVEIIFETVTEQ